MHVEYDHRTYNVIFVVCLLFQVLGSSVANAFELVGCHVTKSNEIFIRKMDTFFDCLNVSNQKSAVRVRKPAREPYRQEGDWRFKVGTCIRYIRCANRMVKLSFEQILYERTCISIFCFHIDSFSLTIYMSQGRSIYIAVPRYTFIPNLFRFSDRAFLCLFSVWIYFYWSLEVCPFYPIECVIS